MTTDRRAKRDARDRQHKTGERYSTARRRTGCQARYIQADHCASCLDRLSNEVDALFCSELCSQTAETIRYWRRVLRDGRYERPDIRDAIRTRVAHLLAGGYQKAARRLSEDVVEQVRRRDGGTCRQCSRPGEEIDHIDGNSPDPGNLQLLCKDCHHAKTAERMVPASADQRAAVDALCMTRVLPDVPALLCDDEQRWQKEWRGLKAARRQRLLQQLEELGFHIDDFQGANRAEMIAVLDDELDADNDEGGRREDDDSGYGPYSYFAHAMAKND